MLDAFQRPHQCGEHCPEFRWRRTQKRRRFQVFAWPAFHFVLDKGLLTNLCIEADNQKITVSELIDQALNRAYFLIEKADFVLSKIITSDFKEDDLVMDCNIKITIDIKFKNKLLMVGMDM